MKHMLRAVLLVSLTLTAGSRAFAAETADLLTQAIQFGAAAEWNRPQDPVRIYGQTYYVGVAGLSSVLIHTDAGSILLDGDLPQSAPLIEANIRKLGFRVEDIKLILNSHAHFDHAGGIAALQRDSGADALASPSGTKALREGHVADDDPQAAISDGAHFPAVAKVRVVHDGETVRLGNIAVTAHFTPGHTPGSTSWTWRDCENSRCLEVVYADSLSPVSAPGFHFLADDKHADLTAPFRKSIQTLAKLPCDILITVHPDLAGIPEKLERQRLRPTPNPFVDAQACRNYAHGAEARLDARIVEENKARAGK
jgi:metallo-beta-lactamase class B